MTTSLEYRLSTLQMLDVYWRLTGRPRRPVREIAGMFGVCERTIHSDFERLKDEGRIPHNRNSDEKTAA